MNTVELLNYSLGNALDILGQVTADLTQEQADWCPPGIANPIGGLYWHTMSSIDQVVNAWCRGQAPLYEQGDWQHNILGDTAEYCKAETLEQMRAVRVDLPRLREYTKTVAGATQGWLASLQPGDVEQVVDTPIGQLSLGQLLETFVIWHINAHCGEISALKGCQGARGYLF
jgi:hypothetical protein